jgi:Transposase DNA-binding/Transposase DDE domain
MEVLRGMSVTCSTLSLGKRHRDRLVRIREDLSAKPGSSFPNAMRDDAALEGFYRFVSNPRVNPRAILAPSIEATAEGAARATSQGIEVVVAHDTTELTYSSARAGLGGTSEVSTSSGRGLFAHVSIALRFDSARSPLGIVGLETKVRTGPAKRDKHTEHVQPEERESERWRRAIRVTEAALGPKISAVHVADSEADAYLMFETLEQLHARFVIRATHDRRVQAAGITGRTKLSKALEGLEGLLLRDVVLSQRAAKKRVQGSRNRNLPRATRLAKLSFSARGVTLRASDPFAKTKAISLNVVHVQELEPPEGEEAVSWILYTTEPIDSPDQVARVVDLYRTRWQIEELFKALKSGCQFEKRQLESYGSISNALAIFLPIACALLRLRSLARAEPEVPAHAALEPDVLAVLQRHPRAKLPPNATAGEAMLAVARMGGHIKNNGAPGWMVLGRGFEKLLAIVDAMREMGLPSLVTAK